MKPKILFFFLLLTPGVLLAQIELKTLGLDTNSRHQETTHLSGHTKPSIPKQFQGPDYRLEENLGKRRMFLHAAESTPYANEDALQAYLSIPFPPANKPTLFFTIQCVTEFAAPLKYIQIKLDDQTYLYKPKKVFEDSGFDMHWQWFDDPVADPGILNLLNQITQAREALLILYFNPHYKVERVISDREKEGLRKVLEAFYNW